MIFFSAHGVPVSYVEDAGDPYRDQMEECIYLIMQELKARGISNKHTLAYQVGHKIWVLKFKFLFPSVAWLSALCQAAVFTFCLTVDFLLLLTT